MKVFDIVRNIFRASTYQQPADWLRLALTGGMLPTASGETVNANTANNYSAVSAARAAIVEPCSTVPLPTYRRLPGGGKERVRDDPRHYALNVMFNPMMTAVQGREYLLDCALGWGNGFADIRFNDFADRLMLDPIHPSYVTLEQKNGKYRYKVTVPNERTQYRFPDQIVHVRGSTTNGIWGDSTIRRARESIGLGLTLERHGSSFFRNGARASGAFTLPTKPPKEKMDQLRHDLEDSYAGSNNSGKFMMLYGGMDFKQFSMPHDDSQYLETRKYQVEEIARWFRVPPYMIGDYSQMKWANIEQAAISYVQYTLRSWMVRIEQELNAKLFTEQERETLFVEHLIDGLLRGDSATRATALQIQRRNGIINANEWRAIENMNPLEGDQGDKYIIEGNMTTLEKVGTETMNQEPNTFNGDEDRGIDANTLDAVNKGFEVMLEDVAARCLRRELNETTKAAKKYEKSKDGDWLTKWSNEFYSAHRAYCRSSVLPVVAAYTMSTQSRRDHEAIASAMMPQLCAGTEGSFQLAVVHNTFNAFSENILKLIDDTGRMSVLSAACLEIRE